MKSSIAPACGPFSLAASQSFLVLAMSLCAVIALSAPFAMEANAQSTPAETNKNAPLSATDRESVRLQNDAIESIKSALDGRRTTEAQQVAEKALREFPDNVQMRFLYGVTLADSGQIEPAIEQFQALVFDHPELAEPYNNLAVLHASQGDLKAARDALESAIANGPAYTLAYENLGDVYLRLAVQAYETGSSDPDAAPVVRRKLVLTRTLVEQVSPGTN